jgi:thiol-disulfide isomerase/thioredoxin/uncharacterized membrane protein
MSFGQRWPTAGAWRLWVPRVLAGATGLILLIAGLVKAMDMELFIRQIRDYGIISQHVLLAMSAWGLIALECALGIGLLIFYRPKITLPLTSLLWLTFLGATSWAWLTGATKECGCFGAWVEHSPKQAVLENLVLLVATLLARVWYKESHRRASQAKAWCVAIAFLSGIALPLAFGFPISRINQSPWEKIEIELTKLDTKGLDKANLSSGTHLIILLDTECEHCKEALPELDALAETTDLPSVIALCPNDESARAAFIENFQPDFPLAQIGESVFLRLLGLGDVPRTILLRDQRVRGVWDKDVPSADIIRAVISR